MDTMENPWIKMKPTDIPTKKQLNTSFQIAVREASSRDGGCRLLDIGCGDGRIAVELEHNVVLSKGSIQVVGVDCNTGAIQSANTTAAHSGVPGCSRAKFMVGDATSLDITMMEAPFDIVLCQLVISVVGGVKERKALLESCRRHLKLGGQILLSASGASEHVNLQYKHLYNQDLSTTGEYRTYLSRAPNGEVMYVTHHFAADELETLLQEAGFIDVQIVPAAEASTRRPDQQAIFLYVQASLPRTKAPSKIPSTRRSSIE